MIQEIEPECGWYKFYKNQERKETIKNGVLTFFLIVLYLVMVTLDTL